MSARRYLSLWLSWLPADRISRREGSAGAAFVITQRVQNALRLAASSRAAAALGLRPGMTLADARARVPDVAVHEEDAAADRETIGRIADWCDRFTPLVGEDGPDALMLDVTGCTHLFGGEAAMCRQMIDRLGRMGFEARAAVAGTPDAARALVRYGAPAAVVVAPGGEAEAVRPLPIAALGIEPDLVLMLARAGLKRIDDLADRPRPPLAARFGRDLVTRLDRALGLDEAPISPRRPVPDFLAEQRFAEPIASYDAIIAVVAALAGELAALLERRGQGGRRFEAAFFRTDGLVARIAVEAGRPMRDATMLTRLFRERLDALHDPLDPGFGFDMIRLSAQDSEAFGHVQKGLDGSEEERAEIEGLIDRLGARFGTGHVLRMVARDSHVPERESVLVPAISPAADTGAWRVPAGGDPPSRPLRMFEPPEPVETLAEIPDGPPVRFRWRRVMHEVVSAEGPERIAPEWWRGEAAGLTRDYFRVEDGDGRRYWLYREGLYGGEVEHPRWYLHGLFA